MLNEVIVCKKKKKIKKLKKNPREMKTFEKSTHHLPFAHFLNSFFIPYFPLQIRTLKCLDHINSYNKFD